MWLTRLLFGKKPPPRRVFSGKHRIPVKVNMRMRHEVLRDLAIEEENLFYLRQPYLTMEQEKGSSSALGKGKVKLEKLHFANKNMKKNVIIDERLIELRQTDAWE